MKRIGLYTLLLIAVIGGCAYVYAMLTGPRMIDQPHIRSYQYRMPLPPQGSVPVEPDPYALPPPAELDRVRNPVPETPDSIARGKIYYHYYCVSCHGDTGQGNGPVGNSYMPKPADLHDPKILNMQDGKLLRAMLTGPGHDPVLIRVVPPQHRWRLVIYARALGREPASGEPANKTHRDDFREKALR